LVKYKGGMWIPSRKRIDIYWFKFLQHSEQDENFKVDWKKYSGWGGSNYILGTKFDDFRKEKFLDLFIIKKIIYTF
jgi:hypothetical protein